MVAAAPLPGAARASKKLPGNSTVVAELPRVSVGPSLFVLDKAPLVVDGASWSLGQMQISGVLLARLVDQYGSSIRCYALKAVKGAYFQVNFAQGMQNETASIRLANIGMATGILIGYLLTEGLHCLRGRARRLQQVLSNFPSQNDSSD